MPCLPQLGLNLTLPTTLAFIGYALLGYTPLEDHHHERLLIIYAGSGGGGSSFSFGAYAGSESGEPSPSFGAHAYLIQVASWSFGCPRFGFRDYSDWQTKTWLNTQGTHDTTVFLDAVRGFKYTSCRFIPGSVSLKPLGHLCVASKPEHASSGKPP
ncbi:hypothetical protein FRB93_002535 [Tulasnella sp. JGI-2019a]|nr:hypothetical protein FRB93_002535 [Tulasnella sp. JGI-2019a]